MVNTSLKAILYKNNERQSSFAKKIGINPVDFNQIINGKKYPYAGWRKKISEALNISEEILFPGVKDGD